MSKQKRQKKCGLPSFVAFMSVLCLTGGSSILLSSCTSLKKTDISEITRRAEMTQFMERGGPFLLTGWQKPNAHNNKVFNTLRVYIEGDGRARITRYIVSTDPTPFRAVGLEMAAADPAPNVVYLARPCQFTNSPYNTACEDRKWWTTHRYDDTTLEAYMEILDRWQKQDPDTQTSYELVGFSGGGAIAMQLASLRDDIKNVRTVAGNINPHATNLYHRVDPMHETYDPWRAPNVLAKIPQIHFVGGQDDVIPSRLTNQVLAKYHKTRTGMRCTRVKVLATASHLEGWGANWRSLVGRSPSCEGNF